MSENYIAANNVVLYVLNHLGTCGMHKLAKILFFADMKHLSTYGRPILEGDYYVKMEWGPVPSNIYGEIKDKTLKSVVSTTITKLTATAKADLDYISESELKCLDESINENKDLSFDELVSKSHGYAWSRAKRKNGPIDLIDIAKEGRTSEEMLEYINLNQELRYAGW